MQAFAVSPEACAAAMHAVKGLANGSQTASLPASRSHDVFVAPERLNSFCRLAARCGSLPGTVSEFVEAAAWLREHTPGEAVADLRAGKIEGGPGVVAVRSQIAARDGKFIGEPDRGKFIQCEPGHF